MSKEIAQQYIQWPYPDIPVIASISREQLWQINVEWMLKRAGLPAPEKRPRIWIAGCGTFQPYTFSQANPAAEILASDISDSSLRLAKRRCGYHFNRNTDFATIDLEDPSKYPEGSFDFIECYGVLMNLKDPGQVLRNLASKLKPNGMLRVMVYPHYGRQRIFQIQRLARLLGLSAWNKQDPQKLRQAVLSLDVRNPLRQTFLEYHDARTKSGIVDGFLHVGDRAFTGTEICELIEGAGLSIAYTMHRPWGDPTRMAKRLQLEGKDAAYLLNYLDVWRSLKSNFILNLVRRDSVTLDEAEHFAHPLFSLKTPKLGIRYRAKLLRLCATGTKVQTRTYDGARDLSAKTVRDMMKGESAGDELANEILAPRIEPRIEPLLSETSRAFRPTDHWAIRDGDGAPSPLDAHLYDNVFFREGRWDLLSEDRDWAGMNQQKFERFPVIPFAEAGDRLTNAQQRPVYQWLDNQGFRKSEWKKSDLLELWYLLFGFSEI